MSFLLKNRSWEWRMDPTRKSLPAAQGVHLSLVFAGFSHQPLDIR